MDVWFIRDVKRLLRLLVAARGTLTSDEQDIIIAVAEGFGLDAKFDDNEFKVVEKEEKRG